MQKPVDGSGRQRFGHQLVEGRRMHIRTDGHRALFVGRETKTNRIRSCLTPASNGSRSQHRIILL
jgi:hypothetical protein